MVRVGRTSIGTLTIEPSAPTATVGFETLSKNCLPSVFTRAGPPPPKYRNTGRSGTTLSSSASVGWRRSNQMFGVPAPIAVMNFSQRTSPRARRAASAARTPATLFASSHCATW